MVHDIEFATVQKQVIDGLKDGNVALEKANAVFSIDEIEDILADTQEAVDKQREIDALISGELTEVMKSILNHHLLSLRFYLLSTVSKSRIYIALNILRLSSLHNDLVYYVNCLNTQTNSKVRCIKT